MTRDDLDNLTDGLAEEISRTILAAHATVRVKAALTYTLIIQQDNGLSTDMGVATTMGTADIARATAVMTLAQIDSATAFENNPVIKHRLTVDDIDTYINKSVRNIGDIEDE